MRVENAPNAALDGVNLPAKAATITTSARLALARRNIRLLVKSHKLSNLSVKRGIETKLIQQIFIDNITKMAGDGLSFFKTGEKVMMVRVVGAYRGIKINWIIDNIFVCWIIEQ